MNATWGCGASPLCTYGELDFARLYSIAQCWLGGKRAGGVGVWGVADSGRVGVVHFQGLQVPPECGLKVNMDCGSAARAECTAKAAAGGLEDGLIQVEGLNAAWRMMLERAKHGRQLLGAD